MAVQDNHYSLEFCDVVKAIICPNHDKMMGALGRDRVYLYIYRNLSGDPALDGHDAEINARITQIHELLRVRDGLDRINEFTKSEHDDVIKWKHFPRYWTFVWGIHRSPVNSPHKGQWRGALIFSLICVWINGWVNTVRLVIWDAIPPIMTSV